MDENEKIIPKVLRRRPGNPSPTAVPSKTPYELDVDCISDGETTSSWQCFTRRFAGVHSAERRHGDAPAHPFRGPSSKRSAPPLRPRQGTRRSSAPDERAGTRSKDEELYIIEVNPRASRTVPFVSKAIGVPLAKLAARVMAGETLKDLGLTEEIIPPYYAVKESVFPFNRFPGAPIMLSPEMRSTGEVMGLDEDLGVAFAKSQMAAKPALPDSGDVFISVKDSDKERAVGIARQLNELGFGIISTAGTAKYFKAQGIEVKNVYRLSEGRPNVIDLIKNHKIALIINTPQGTVPRQNENQIRTQAVKYNVCIMTTISAASAAVDGIRALREKGYGVRSIQDYGELLPS